MKDLAGKVAVVPGAGSGFGREFARIAAGERMNLVLADVQDDALHAVVGEVRAGGVEALGVHTDVARAEDVQELADRATAKFGAVHLLFNNAGVAGGGGYVWETSLKDWQWLLGVNLMGVVNGIRSFIPLMLREDCECHVVNTASAAGGARMTFEAVRENRFYVITHPKMLASVELRMQDVLAGRNPSDPYTFKPAVKPR